MKNKKKKLKKSKLKKVKSLPKNHFKINKSLLIILVLSSLFISICAIKQTIAKEENITIIKQKKELKTNDILKNFFIKKLDKNKILENIEEINIYEIVNKIEEIIKIKNKYIEILKPEINNKFKNLEIDELKKIINNIENKISSIQYKEIENNIENKTKLAQLLAIRDIISKLINNNKYYLRNIDINNLIK